MTDIAVRVWWNGDTSFAWEWTATPEGYPIPERSPRARGKGTALTRLGARFAAWRWCRNFARHDGNGERWRFTRTAVVDAPQEKAAA